jgi:hypothetical protein
MCRIYRIIFFARGEVGSAEQACFGFTCAADEQHVHPAVHCHIFRYLILYFFHVYLSTEVYGMTLATGGTYRIQITEGHCYFNDLVGLTNKKLPNNMLVKKVNQLVELFLANFYS